MENDICAIDNKIKELKKQKDEIMKQKSEKTDFLLETMNQHELQTISTQTCVLKKHKRTTRQGISKKYLLEVLRSYYSNPVDVLNVTKHVMDNRETKVKEFIKMKS